MAVTVPAPPYKSPFSGPDGRLTPIWIAWFRELFLRVGGLSALSNAELETLPYELVEDLQEDVNALETDINTAESNITSLQSQVYDLWKGPTL